MYNCTDETSFTDETLKNKKITLVESNRVVSSKSQLAQIFSKYFGKIVQNLQIDGLVNILQIQAL